MNKFTSSISLEGKITPTVIEWCTHLRDPDFYRLEDDGNVQEAYKGMFDPKGMLYCFEGYEESGDPYFCVSIYADGGLQIGNPSEDSISLDNVIGLDAYLELNGIQASEEMENTFSLLLDRNKFSGKFEDILEQIKAIFNKLGMTYEAGMIDENTEPGSEQFDDLIKVLNCDLEPILF